MPVKVESPLPSGTGLVDSAKQLFTAAFGFSSPKAQMVSSAILAAVLIATSAVGLVGTIVLLPIPIFLFTVGLIRLIYGRIR